MDIQANQVSSAVSRRKVRALLLGDRIDTSPAPITTREIDHDRGPVLVTVEYRIDPKDRNAFLARLNELVRERRRDGAYRWRVFEDAAEEARFVETFLVQSWLEHLRQHERVTNADRLLQDAIARFHMGGTPQVTHLIAAEPIHCLSLNFTTKGGNLGASPASKGVS
jgi:quinol monooxygenase YgiN